MLCERPPAETGRDAPNSGCSRREENIRLSIDRFVCPKRSSCWQSISGDSRMRPLSNSSGCPDAMDPERGSVGSGAVVALCRTVACCVSARKCRAGEESAAWQAGAAPRLSGALRGGSGSEVQCRTGAFWGNQGLTGALRLRGRDSCRPLPRSSAQLR